MKFLLPLLVFTFRAHAFIADFLAIFDSYVLENVIYETVSFPSHVDENDFNSELAIRLAQNVPFSAKIRKEVKTLSLLEFSNAMNIDKSVGEQRGQFIKDPFETFLLYTAVDIKHLLANMTFYAELKSLFPMQPFMFSLSHHDEKSNAYEVHELQIFARRSIKLAQWDQQEKSIEYMNTNAIKRRQNLSGVELTTCHESEMPFFSFDKDTGDYLGSTGSILALFQKKFQFSILWSNFSAFGGITENGSRTGVIGDLLQEKLDFSGVDMINSDDRRDISFGFTLVTTTQFLWFHKTKQSNSDWFALLGVFDPLFWAAVASVMIVCFLTLQLANSKKYRAKGCSPMEFSVMSFSFVVKSFLGQSHDESQLFSFHLGWEKANIFSHIGIFHVIMWCVGFYVLFQLPHISPGSPIIHAPFFV